MLVYWSVALHWNLTLRSLFWFFSFAGSLDVSFDDKDKKRRDVKISAYSFSVQSKKLSSPFFFMDVTEVQVCAS
jgi:hypothetical protein